VLALGVGADVLVGGHGAAGSSSVWTAGLALGTGDCQ
jgi:hypothetical protein